MTETTALQKKQDEFTLALKENLKSITSVLPEGMDAKRFCRMAVNCLLKNPALANCTKESFVMAVINCGEAGLEPSLGQAALVPYKGQVQFQPMYQGLVELCRRSGQISTIYSEVVHEGDEFEYELGLNPKLVHKPGPKKKGWTHVYAVAKLKDGSTQFDVMTNEDVMKIKKRSAAVKSKKSSPWDTDEEAMAKKTVIKQLCKLLPKTSSLTRALDLDSLAEAGKVQPPTMADLSGSSIDLSAVAGEPEATGRTKPAPKKGATSKPAPEEKPPEQPPIPANRDAFIEEIKEFPNGPVKRALEKMGLREDTDITDLSDEELEELYNRSKAAC